MLCQRSTDQYLEIDVPPNVFLAGIFFGEPGHDNLVVGCPVTVIRDRDRAIRGLKPSE